MRTTAVVARIASCHRAVDHRVDWDDDALAELFALGVKDCRFCLDVAIEAFALAAVSPPLYVPFEPIG